MVLIRKQGSVSHCFTHVSSGGKIILVGALTVREF